MIKVGQVYRYVFEDGSYSIEKIVKIENETFTYQVLDRPRRPNYIGRQFDATFEEFNTWIERGTFKLDKEWRFKQLIEEMQKHISKH